MQQYRTMRTLKSKAQEQARANGHLLGTFRTLHSTAAVADCAHCSGSVWVHLTPCAHDGAQIRGTTITQDTCADRRAQGYGAPRQTEKKRIRGRMLDCVRLGEWADTDGRKYTAWQSATNTLCAWVRLEPFDGGRAQIRYDPGQGISKVIHMRAQTQTQTGA
jgi:hypothetical protein